MEDKRNFEEDNLVALCRSCQGKSIIDISTWQGILSQYISNLKERSEAA